MSHSHLIDPAMNRLGVNSRLTHFVPYPDARLSLKRQTLIPEPMSYRLLLQHKQRGLNVYLFRMSFNSVKIK